MPVVNSRGKILGVVDMIDALLIDENESAPVRAAMKPAVFLPGNTTVREALAKMQGEHIGLAIVTRFDGKPAGVVTMKDLLEPLTGEIINW